MQMTRTIVLHNLLTHLLGEHISHGLLEIFSRIIISITFALQTHELAKPGEIHVWATRSWNLKILKETKIRFGTKCVFKNKLGKNGMETISLVAHLEKGNHTLLALITLMIIFFFVHHGNLIWASSWGIMWCLGPPTSSLTNMLDIDLMEVVLRVAVLGQLLNVGFCGSIEALRLYLGLILSN
ncbi:hypothetical protein ACJX0J_037434, partial [Zea mays]